jgi:hypothetical protein
MMGFLSSDYKRNYIVEDWFIAEDKYIEKGVYLVHKCSDKKEFKDATTMDKTGKCVQCKTEAPKGIIGICKLLVFKKPLLWSKEKNDYE